MNWQAIILTLRLAVTVSAVLIIIGLPLGYWIAFSRWRWKFLIESLVAMPLVLPPTVLGFYFLLLLGRGGLVGAWLYRIFGVTLPFSFAGLVIASVLYSMPFAVQPLVVGFAAVDHKLIAASALLGASRLRTFLRVILPLSLTHLITAVVLSFAHTLGEFGVVLMVGGNIPGVTRTISIAIYDNVQALNYASANQNALCLLIFSFVILSVVYALNRRASFFGTAP
ncbi:MAG TPA: molybdate ABC transporter permease subunit [Terriglobales bacterium]|jgi:molybdate transport system permease protein|nr:molybdate ABC transporter permease subunit [Terriglobales bacterium]